MGFQGNAISIGVAVFACACSEPPTEGAGRTITMPPSTAAAAAGNAAQMSSDSAPSTPSTGNSSSDAPLITPTTEVQTTSCRPGHYIGEFYGEYFSGAWLDGAEPLPFATADVDGKPGFEFWLEAVDRPCEPGQEFCAGAIVKGGKLRGNATPFEDADDPNTQGGLGFSVRFEIDLTGELDCMAGTFRGRLENGCYDILSVLYRFDGAIDGSYSLTTNEFSSGVWEVSEMLMPGAAPLNPLGGNGSWSASYRDDSPAPTGEDTGLCAGESGFDTEL